jgi:hypothetical protein
MEHALCCIRQAVWFCRLPKRCRYNLCSRLCRLFFSRIIILYHQHNRSLTSGSTTCVFRRPNQRFRSTRLPQCIDLLIEPVYNTMAAPMTKHHFHQLMDAIRGMNSRLQALKDEFAESKREITQLKAQVLPQAPAPLDDEAPVDEALCDEPSCEEQPSVDEPSCDETPCQIEPCQIEPPCKSIYEPLRHRVKLLICQYNTSTRTQLEPSLFRADDVADTPGESIIQGVIIAVDELTSAGWYRDVFTCVDRWKHRAGKQHGDDILG